MIRPAVMFPRASPANVARVEEQHARPGGRRGGALLADRAREGREPAGLGRRVLLEPERLLWVDLPVEVVGVDDHEVHEPGRGPGRRLREDVLGGGRREGHADRRARSAPHLGPRGSEPPHPATAIAQTSAA